MQAFEGSHNVRITNNAIGPAGVGCDVESGRWADGISYAAADGLVAGNLVIDTTDGGIGEFAFVEQVPGKCLILCTKFCLMPLERSLHQILSLRKHD